MFAKAVLDGKVGTRNIFPSTFGSADLVPGARQRTRLFRSRDGVDIMVAMNA
jgi:hypothetical protein